MSMADKKYDRLQVAVAQIGARHHYAIPRMLEKAGCLAAFHTDANAVLGLGKWLTRLPVLGSRGPLKNLAQRNVAGVPRAKPFGRRKIPHIFANHIATFGRVAIY